jgi:hypothetical protein
MSAMLGARRVIDRGNGPLFWDLRGKEIEVVDTPPSHQPGNILGLGAVRKLGLT